MIMTSLALVMALQNSGETLEAVRNDDPETWSVEYPRIVRPFVVKYRQCLNISDRRVTGEADFEAQHRSDIPRCAKKRKAAIEGATAEMQGAKTRLSASEIDTLFRNIGLIHIARGRDLDEQFTGRLTRMTAVRTQYEEDKPKGLVLELVNGSVVKSRADAQSPESAQSEADN